MSMRTVLLAAMAMAMLAFFFHSPLPDGISDQWTLKTVIAGFRLANLMAFTGEVVGYDTALNTTRKVFASMFAMTSQPISDNGLVITNTLMSGIKARVYRPSDVTDGELLPVVIYYHGGAMIIFSIDTYDNVLRRLSKDVRAVVIAVDYRLAPENPYPAGLEDCVKVTRHVMRYASDYYGDSKRIALAGDSAGGNLAASVALQLADSPEVREPKLQILLYPMLQAFDFQLPSYVVMNGATYEIISSEPIAAAWYMYCTGKLPSKLPGLLANNHTSKTLKLSKFASYVSLDLLDNSMVLKAPPKSKSMMFDPDLAKDLESCITDPFFSPLMEPDFSKFPNSYVMTSEYDILRDEGIMFVSRLKEAGVTFHHNHIQDGWHGIVSYTRTAGGRQALDDVIKFLNQQL